MSLSPKFLRLTGCSAFFVFASAFAAVQPSVVHEASAVVRHNPQADLPPMLQDFDSYVDSARKTFNVPGIAVAIVKDGKVVFEQGYGLREVGKPEKVDAHPVRDCIQHQGIHRRGAADAGRAGQGGYGRSRHRLSAVVSDVRSVRDARDAHARFAGAPQRPEPGRGRSAVLATDQLHDQGRGRTPAKVPLTNGFRSHYAYDNILFAVATLIIEKASGQSYADYVRDHIFKPVGMDESLVDMTYLKPGMDVRRDTPLRLQGSEAGAADGMAQRSRARRHLCQRARSGQMDERAAWPAANCLAWVRMASRTSSVFAR
jgi:CubicO group peptidase (beta-lactamase class C family)